MSWTDANVERLRTLWASGESAGMIAHELGRISRNAVIGKIHRLGLTRDPRPPRSDRPAAKQAPRYNALQWWVARTHAPVPNSYGVKPADIVTMQDMMNAPIPLSKLTNSTCRWPVGEPESPSFGFCGNQSANLAENRPYCTEHALRAYLPRSR